MKDMRVQRLVAAVALTGLTSLGAVACSSDEPAATGTSSQSSTQVVDPTNAASSSPESSQDPTAASSDPATSEAPTSDAASTDAASSESSSESSSSEATNSSEPSTPAPSSDETTSEAPSSETSSAGTGDLGEAPSWANPTVIKGDLIATVEAEDFKVEVYQVGTAKASKDGMFVDPDTKKSLIAKGDELVYVNYVVTNTSDKVIPLGSSLVAVDAEYADWQWMQGMDGIVDRAQYEEMGLDSNAFATGSRQDPPVYEFAPGQTFSYAENFKYQKNSPITFKVRATPVDDDGKLVHDLRQEAEAEGVIS